jgi:hypothetical protein
MKKLNQRIFILLMLAAATTIAKAQTTIPPDTAGISKFAASLSVSREKAIRIRQAMHHRQQEIGLIMRDRKLSNPEKQVAVSKLLGERRRKLDSLLTPKQKTVLDKRDKKDIKSQDAAMKDMQKRHEAEMNKIPHERTIRGKADTIKRK